MSSGLLTLTLSLIFISGAFGDCLVPGKLNPNVQQSSIQSTVCVPNWTATVRPPVSYTNKLKTKQMQQFALQGKLSDYEEDHCVPLALGGHPTDPNNLWPQSWTGRCNARLKDVLEAKLHRAVCRHQVTLAEAQRLVHRWCPPPT